MESGQGNLRLHFDVWAVFEIQFNEVLLGYTPYLQTLIHAGPVPLLMGFHSHNTAGVKTLLPFTHSHQLGLTKLLRNHPKASSLYLTMDIGSRM